MELLECIEKRRDTRHFLPDPVPEAILKKALWCAHQAPSVGMSEPWRMVLVESAKKRQEIINNFQKMSQKAEEGLTGDEKLGLYKSLKLEAISEAPVGLAMYCEFPENFTIGTIGNRDTLVWSCACTIQNMWLYLTSAGYSLGWVSILDYEGMSEILEVPKSWQLLGYLCIGKPATDYDGKPMLEKLGWKPRSSEPVVIKR